VDAAGVALPAHLDAMDGGMRIAVDATGATWPVTVDPTITQATLTPQTPPGSTAQGFGASIAVAAANGTTTVVVGAPTEYGPAPQYNAGAVYIFMGSGGTYTQRARLVPSNGAPDQAFGTSVAVAISGGTTTVVVGTCCDNRQAYVFTGSGGTYAEQARLVAPDPTNNDAFGAAVAAATNGANTIIAVGASSHTVGGNSGQGSVYLFAGSGSAYPLQAELNAPDAQAGEGLGSSVALISNGGANTLTVGRIGSIVLFTGSGTTYGAVTLSTVGGSASGGSISAEGNYPNVAVGVNGGITTVVGGVPLAGVSNFAQEGVV
jgi:hypothetical protein